MEYIHKSVYEYFVQKKVMKELHESKGEQLDINNSCLSKSLLKRDLDILRSICKDMQYI